jgi:hypothetical protein
METYRLPMIDSSGHLGSAVLFYDPRDPFYGVGTTSSWRKSFFEFRSVIPNHVHRRHGKLSSSLLRNSNIDDMQPQYTFKLD